MTLNRKGTRTLVFNDETYRFSGDYNGLVVEHETPGCQTLVCQLACGKRFTLRRSDGTARVLSKYSVDANVPKSFVQGAISFALDHTGWQPQSPGSSTEIFLAGHDDGSWSFQER